MMVCISTPEVERKGAATGSSPSRHLSHVSTNIEMHGVPKLALSVEEAAWAIGVSKRKVDELIADRTSGFPVTRIGRRCVVVVESLAKWLTDHVGKTA